MLYRTWLVVAFSFSGFMACCQAGDFAPFAGTQPVAVLVQENPWADVMGAETPRIAVYENGDVIYSRQAPGQKQEVYFYAKLDFSALSDLEDRLRPVVAMPGLKLSYSLTGATDQASALLYLRVDQQEIVTSVYGLNAENAGRATPEPGGDPLPAQLRQLYQYLFAVDFTESRSWHPAYVETMIWPYEDAPAECLHWPATWPGLNSDRVLKRAQGWSIFLDGSRQEDLKKFLDGAPEGGAVEIGGKKWSVAWRPAFPSEPVWRKAFSSLTDH